MKKFEDKLEEFEKEITEILIDSKNLKKNVGCYTRKLKKFWQKIVEFKKKIEKILTINWRNFVRKW